MTFWPDRMTPPDPYSFETAMSSLTLASAVLSRLDMSEPQRDRVRAQVAALTGALASEDIT